MNDLRFALRSLRKAPGFTAVAVLTLALGIGATTVMIGVVDGVILRPLPFRAPDRLVRLWEVTPEGADFSTSEPDYLDFAREGRTLEAMAAFRQAPLSLTGRGEPQRLRGMATTYSLFPVLGVQAQLGRTFSAAEDMPGGPRVVVLTDAVWRRVFGADSSVVGKAVTLDGAPFTVIGIMPPGFDYPGAELWIPLRPSLSADRSDHWLDVIGRLRPGATLAQARADLAAVAARLDARYAERRGWSIRLATLADAVVGPRVRRAAWVLLGAVGLLLLLACANVANLQLARATTRRTEMGVRAALGAGRRRLVHQMLTEGVVLAGLAAGLGVVGAYWGIATLHVLGAGRIPRLDDVSLSARVLGATVAVFGLTTLAFGLLPALRSSRVALHTALRASARSGSARGQRRSRDVLVALQVGLSLVLLIGAGLLLRSFVRLNGVDVGFDAERVLAVDLQIPPAYDDVRRAAFFDDLITRLEAIPGVRRAGATAVGPFSGWNFSNDVTPASRVAEAPPAGLLQAGWRSVTPGFFAAMGIPLLRGRTFTAADRDEGARVVVLSRALARRLWPAQDAVGRRLYWGGTTGRTWTVVGVVGDVRDVRLDADAPPLLFLPYARVPMPGMTVVVRGQRGSEALGGPILAAVRALDPALPVPDVYPLETQRVAALAGPRFNLSLLAAFALLALVLAASGVYAVVAFTVEQRRREIGIRVALGARPHGVVRAFVRSSMELAAIGIGAGWIVGMGAAHALAGLLYGIQPTDPVTLVAVPLLLAVVVLVASYVPARRAASIQPMEALRDE